MIQKNKFILVGIIGIVCIGMSIFLIRTVVQLQTVRTSIEKNNGPFILLLHGLGRTSVSMLPLGAALAEQHYRVMNIGYPSKSASIEELTDAALTTHIARIIATEPEAEIHIVTHSLGGILARNYLSTADGSHIRSVVMLAPPHQGSHMADRWSSTALGRYVLGPAISELRTDETSFVRVLPTPTNVPIGIIVGAYDAKVSLADAWYTTTTSMVVVPYQHTFIMQQLDTIKYILSFLNTNKFE
jgi:pimeloyl-ACP methyl ester carboxylesterase